jgi:hypothetical protein
VYRRSVFAAVITSAALPYALFPGFALPRKEGRCLILVLSEVRTMSAKVMSIGALALSTLAAVTPTHGGNDFTNRTFLRACSFSGASVNHLPFRHWIEVCAPAIAATLAHDGQVAYSQFPWFPGGMNAQTTGLTSSPVHPTMTHALVDAQTVGAWTGWGYGPFGNSTYGGFYSQSTSNGTHDCPDEGDNPGPPTRRFAYHYVVAIRSPNVWMVGGTGIAGMMCPQSVVASVVSDALEVAVEVCGTGFMLRYKRPENAAWTFVGPMAQVNHLLRVEVDPCAGWFIDARSGVAQFRLLNAGPLAAGIAGIGAYGWQYQDDGNSLTGDVMVIPNPVLREHNAPAIKPMVMNATIPAFGPSEEIVPRRAQSSLQMRVRE